jgi:hypothetical protein
MVAADESNAGLLLPLAMHAIDCGNGQTGAEVKDGAGGGGGGGAGGPPRALKQVLVLARESSGSWACPRFITSPGVVPGGIDHCCQGRADG